MTVTASSGSTRVQPQCYDTLPLSSVRQAEQEDRFPDGGELNSLITFFQSGQRRVEAARRISANAEFIVAKAANRIFSGGTALSYLDAPLSSPTSTDEVPLAADQEAFQKSVKTFAGAADNRGNALSRLFEGSGGGEADVRIVLPSGFSPISVGRYGTERMRKSIRDMAWFLRYVGYALVAGDPSILTVNTRGLRDLLEKGCSLAATNLALQEMRAAAAGLFKDDPATRQLVIEYFNVLLKELEVPTPSTQQRLGSSVNQGLQLPAIYALAAQGKAQRFVMKPAMSGGQKAEVIRAAYRQVFERDIVKGYGQVVCPVETTQVRQGQISMREFIRALGRSKEYQKQFYGRFSNSRAVELAFRHFLGRGISSREEFNRYFAIVSVQGLPGLVDSLVNSMEYARAFGEETVPFLRDIGVEAQESAGWGSNRKLFKFSAPFEGAPQYVTLYSSYRQPLADQHPYGGGNDPIGLTFGAIFPSATASVNTRPAPFSYDTRRLLVGNGIEQPGQMNSPQFRQASPRRVGPKVVRLQQIATGGNSIPRRGGQPSVRGTESSTQAVINAVYVQVLGNAGYAGERSEVAENRLENGDINLREFVRQVARSKAFRRRYWSGLYITKAIEVIHRRLLGRPTFGRWEIDAYFDTAARKGLYEVLDQIINSQEYTECFGEDTVPYERFITPSDRNARAIPSLNRKIRPELYRKLEAQRRPEISTKQLLKVPGDLTERNLKDQNPARGEWSAAISDNAPDPRWASLVRNNQFTLQPTPPADPTKLRGPFSISESGFQKRSFRRPAGIEGTQFKLSPDTGKGSLARPEYSKVLELNDIENYVQRLGRPELKEGYTEEELNIAVQKTYLQLLNRIPFENERLSTAESRLRNRDLTLEGFIAEVAQSPSFQTRLATMAPLRAAGAAGKALLGRAASPEEVSKFLITRAQSGQGAAISEMLARHKKNREL